MGKTYLATDNSSGKKVALKLLTFSDIDDWKILELFEREIKTLGAMDHPLIPDYLDNFRIEEGKDIYYVLVQEYIEGKNLLDLISGGKRFTEDEVMMILRSLLKTISYIHSLHPPIIHRDINPKNIILAPDNKVYLIDFGAVADPGKLAGGSTVVGTLGYMPQEQLYGKIKPASDMYALGATIVFILTGKEPSEFELKNMRLDYHPEVAVSRKLTSVLDKMLDPDYNKRLTDTKAALDILDGKASLPATTRDFAGTERVIVRQDPEGNKTVSFKTSKVMYFFLIVFAIAWNSFIFGFMGNANEFGDMPIFINLFMLPFFAAGIGMIGMIFYGFFGKIGLVLTGEELMYKNSIFGVIFKRKSIPYNEIRDIKVTEERGSKGSISHVLTVFGPGTSIKIGKLQNLDKGELEYLRDMLKAEVS
ncbi:MAG: serine/threonine protein kinase [Spirochaetales bacterium]|nr:serine/threonine protein kinase [Spirochaetales bacterium]